MESDEGGFRVIYEAFLVKAPEKISRFNKWQKRYFVLRKNKRLEYWSDILQNELKGCINLKKCFGVSDQDDKYSGKKGFAFSVHLPQRKYILLAETRDQRKEWVSALKAVCEIKSKTIIPDANHGNDGAISASDFRNGADDGSGPYNPSITSVMSSQSSTGSFFEESDEEEDEGDDQSDPFSRMTILDTEAPSTQPHLRKVESFREVPELLTGDGTGATTPTPSSSHGRSASPIGDLDGAMFQNPLRKLRQGSTRRKGEHGELTYDAMYTQGKTTKDVFIKVSKPSVIVTAKDSMTDMFEWRIDTLDTYSQEKSILSINTADGKSHVFVVTDGNVASAITRTELS